MPIFTHKKSPNVFTSSARIIEHLHVTIALIIPLSFLPASATMDVVLHTSIQLPHWLCIDANRLGDHATFEFYYTTYNKLCECGLSSSHPVNNTDVGHLLFTKTRGEVFASLNNSLPVMYWCVMYNILLARDLWSP